jgi:hypothetical protein
MAGPQDLLAEMREALSARRTALRRGDEGTATAMADRAMRNGDAWAAAQLPPWTDLDDAPPPRPVASALAAALFVGPHLAHTLDFPGTYGEPIPFRASPMLAEALGLTHAEVQAERARVDASVATLLQTQTLLRALWSAGGDPGRDPRPLAGLLFGPRGPVVEGFVKRGLRIYALCRTDIPLPPEALQLTWMPTPAPAALWPDASFQPEMVPDSVRGELRRMIGVSEEVLAERLRAAIAVLPVRDPNAFLQRDRWRNEGWADLTGLGQADGGPAWTTWPVEDEDVDLGAWDRDAFDAMAWMDREALRRVTAVHRAHHAELAARTLGGESRAGHHRALLLDVEAACEVALSPLAQWARAPSTHARLAQRWPNRPEIGPALQRAADEALPRWVQLGTEAPTVARRLTEDLLLRRASLSRLMAHPGHPRFSHARIALLFSAIDAARTSLPSLWAEDDAPEAMSRYVYAAWRSVLEAQAGED